MQIFSSIVWGYLSTFLMLFIDLIFFVPCTLGGIAKKPLPKTRSWSFTSVFLFFCFIVLAVTFRSLIHFGVNFYIQHSFKFMLQWFNFSLFLKDRFNEFIGWHSYSLNTLNIPPHCLYCPWFLMRNQVNLVNDELLLYCCFQDFLCLCISTIWYVLSRCYLLWGYPIWSSLSFLDMWINVLVVFYQIWDISTRYFSHILSTSLALFSPGIPIMCVFIHLNIHYRPLHSANYFSSSFFLFCSSSDLSLSSMIVSSTLSSLLLCPSSKFYFSFTAFLLRNFCFVFFFLINFIYLLVVSIWWNIVLIFSLIS